MNSSPSTLFDDKKSFQKNTTNFMFVYEHPYMCKCIERGPERQKANHESREGSDISER